MPAEAGIHKQSSSGFPLEFIPAKAGAGMTDRLTWTAVMLGATNA